MPFTDESDATSHESHSVGHGLHERAPSARKHLTGSSKHLAVGLGSGKHLHAEHGALPSSQPLPLSQQLPPTQLPAPHGLPAPPAATADEQDVVDLETTLVAS